MHERSVIRIMDGAQAAGLLEKRLDKVPWYLQGPDRYCR